MAKTRVLVTGHRGFLGRNLFESLKGRPNVELYGATRGKRDLGVKPYSCMVEGDCSIHEFYQVELASPEQVRRLMVHVKPDLVYHLAANPIVKEDAEHPTDISWDNIVATHNLLAFAPKGCQFVFASSATVYGDTHGDRVNENYETKPTSVYATTKLAGEELVLTYTRLGRVNGVILRLVANVGPYSTHGLLHDIIIKLRSNNTCLELIGEAPGSIKPFLYTRDTVAAFHAAAAWKPGEIFNISNRNSLSVTDVAHTVMDRIGIGKRIKWLGNAANWAGDNPHVRLSIHKAEIDGGWVPKYVDEQAIVAAIDAILLSEQEKQ